MKELVFAITSSSFILVFALGCGSGTASTQTRTMEVTILVPADVQEYNEMITGEQDFKRAAELPFVKKKVVVLYSTDLIRASADAAARELGPSQAGPTTVVYLKTENGTAYVLLNIDRDGWAGVSFSWARSHPVVEKTLLQFKRIKRVVWDEAPDEKRPYAIQFETSDSHNAEVARASALPAAVVQLVVRRDRVLMV